MVCGFTRGDRRDVATRPRTVLSIPHSATNHNGGQLQFGPDGYLYIGIGDGGAAATRSNGQDTTVLLGKILRIDPRAAVATRIPPGQPFAAGAAPEIWAYGLRNPWRFWFDALTGDLLIADVGDRQLGGDRPAPAGQPPRRELRVAVLGGHASHGSCELRRARGHPADLRVRARRHALLDHRRLHRARSDGADARRPLPLRRLLRPGRQRARVPVGSPPDIGVLGAARHIAGFGSDSDGHLYITSLDGGVWRVTGTGAADKPPVANFTLSTTTPAVGANVHLDASSSTDPDGPIISYSWDVDGDGKADGKGVTFDVSYPTAGAGRSR